MIKVLVTGCCGFAGFNIIKSLSNCSNIFEFWGLDNLTRKGSEISVSSLLKLGVHIIRGDVRIQSDIDALPAVDWVIDCAAIPSVLAGVDGQVSSRQLMEHNLLGTINLLEYCKSHKAGLILLSTSRVYSATQLAALPVEPSNNRFELIQSETAGVSSSGISENFPTSAPLSLYGASKLASETLILEYGECFDFPVWINRCGVLAGAGQFGKTDQGIFSYWIHSFREKKPLKYIGFNGSGHQVRDALHPKDLVPLLSRQMMEPDLEAPKIINLGGGIENSISLKQLSAWCQERFGENEVIASEKVRPMDAPWIVMDSKTARNAWNWRAETKIEQVLDEIANHAEQMPNWLNVSQ
ncbi:NAD-dependent epimerase/dehydratase family protein [Opitutales bacterium]|nr:NAD-dependent epimerase/dehydratase family protein [Opitutales bacterium]